MPAPTDLAADPCPPCLTTERSFAVPPLQFDQHGPQQFVVWDAGDEGSLGRRAHDGRGIAFLLRPARSVPVFGCKLGAGRWAISELSDAGPTA